MRFKLTNEVDAARRLLGHYARFELPPLRLLLWLQAVYVQVVAAFALVGLAALHAQRAQTCDLLIAVGSRLRDLFRKFRDEELEHKDTGIEYDAERATFFRALSNVIKAGCRAAVYTSERV